MPVAKPIAAQRRSREQTGVWVYPANLAPNGRYLYDADQEVAVKGSTRLD